MSTVIAQATFRIYRDKPSSHPQSKSEAFVSSKLSRTRRLVEISSAADKENLHPVTGLPARILTSSSKKRKTDVLTTKLLAIAETPSSPKKRKVLASSSQHVFATVKSAKQRGTNSRHTKSSKALRLHRRTELPHVDEVNEAGEAVRAVTRLSPEAVDARCYELTVLPLADISEAYETSSDDDCITRGGPPPADHQHQEGPSPSKTSQESRTEPIPTPSTDGIVLDTPERKRIYSAFTFTSPSPVGKRHTTSSSKHGHGFADVHCDSGSSILQ
ncbi:hypothetical protein NM688_g377 [Phlebia brevispora]|uniref:Uncharacterized protein n=1 Tax=Phlebia brevispora TaxID=194682 RepID=A0ACC1TEM8_9APHY|nr:hypothetical protein NM688_g377 [Phlebia brevispora]